MYWQTSGNANWRNGFGIPGSHFATSGGSVKTNPIVAMSRAHQATYDERGSGRRSRWMPYSFASSASLTMHASEFMAVTVINCRTTGMLLELRAFAAAYVMPQANHTYRKSADVMKARGCCTICDQPSLTASKVGCLPAAMTVLALSMVHTSGAVSAAARVPDATSPAKVRASDMCTAPDSCVRSGNARGQTAVEDITLLRGGMVEETLQALGT
mmetsp:Transcript_19392/g.39518  ORF Transcript_19392/g.39518 Transcript_19392/m.39518 type:complete len:214 (-) Transcript_19392:72-713(-)